MWQCCWRILYTKKHRGCMYICSWRSTVRWEMILVLYFLWPCIKQCKFYLFYNDEGFTSNGSRPKWCIPTLLQCPLEGIWMHPQFLNILLCCHYSNNSFSQRWFFFNQCEWNSALSPLDIIQLLDIKKTTLPIFVGEVITLQKSSWML